VVRLQAVFMSVRRGSGGREGGGAGAAPDVEVIRARGRAAGVGVHAALVAGLVEVRLVHQDQRLDGHQHLRGVTLQRA